MGSCSHFYTRASNCATLTFWFEGVGFEQKVGGLQLGVCGLGVKAFPSRKVLPKLNNSLFGVFSIGILVEH